MVAVACALLVLSFGHGRDQSIYALVARELLDGGMPYRDAFDFKPPGIFLVYAFARALFGGAEWGIRVVEVASLAATFVGLVRLSKLHLGRSAPGYIAGALASQIHAQLDFWHTGQPESFGGSITVWGLVLGTLAHRHSSPPAKVLRFVGCGVLFGLSGLMKPPLAGVGALVGLAAAIDAWRSAGGSLRPKLIASALPLIATAVGGVLPIALTLGWFAAKGALGDLHQVLFVFTPFYTKISWEQQSVLGLSYYGFTEWLTTYSSGLLAGIVCTLWFRPERQAWGAFAVLTLAIFIHIAGVVMQAKFFPYHFGATFPLTALLAAIGLERGYHHFVSKGPVQGSAFVATFALIAAAHCPVPSFGQAFASRTARRLEIVMRPPPDPQLAWDALASVADVNAIENRAVGHWLREHTAPGDPVFVWGFECAIYDIAERPLASRYIYNVPQRAVWSQAPMQAALMKDLEAKPPAAIVVEHRDVFRMVTGSDFDSARSLYEFPALRAMLDERYRFEASIGDFDLYLRDDASAPQ